MKIRKAVFPVAGLGTRFFTSHEGQPQGDAAGGG